MNNTILLAAIGDFLQVQCIPVFRRRTVHEFFKGFGKRIPVVEPTLPGHCFQGKVLPFTLFKFANTVLDALLVDKIHKADTLDRVQAF